MEAFKTATATLTRVIREPNRPITHLPGEEVIVKAILSQGTLLEKTLVKVFFPKTETECLIFMDEFSSPQ
jgi:hypothetical protein